MVIELKVNYSVNDLAGMYGDLWAQHLGLCPVPKEKNKPEIFVFDDFDHSTQQVYKKILCFLLNKNANKDFNVWAVGSRISGTWKTREEAEYLCNKYNIKNIKYSDYDFLTDAEFLPSNAEIKKYINEEYVAVDGLKYSEIPNIRKVLIIKN